MCCGIIGDELMVRLGPDYYRAALARKHTREMDFTGRPLEGFLYIGSPGLRSDSSVRTWVDRGVAFARSLPPK